MGLSFTKFISSGNIAAVDLVDFPGENANSFDEGICELHQFHNFMSDSGAPITATYGY